MKRAKSKTTIRSKTVQSRRVLEPKKLPFIEHIYELRKRLFYVTISVCAFGGAAYGIERHLEAYLLKPAGNQEFIFTSPGGGFNFVFNICLYVGIAASIPVIIFQILRYIQPLIHKDALRMIAWGSVVSGFLAVFGVLFGYFYGLPSSINFLLHSSVSNSHIKALLSIQSYMSFVMMYLLGAALLFQVPLIIVMVNRIKPFPPGKLMKFQRWFIVFAFVVGAMINPSPTIKDQLTLSLPMILMYQVGVIIVWFTNRHHHKPKKVHELLQKDSEIQNKRLAQFEAARQRLAAQLANQQAQKRPVTAAANSKPSGRMMPPVKAIKAVAVAPTPAPAPVVVAAPPQQQVVVATKPIAPPTPTLPERPRPYLDQFNRRPYRAFS